MPRIMPMRLWCTRLHKKAPLPAFRWCTSSTTSMRSILCWTDGEGAACTSSACNRRERIPGSVYIVYLVKYMSVIGNNSCVPCPVNLYMNYSGADDERDCFACPSNSKSNEGSSSMTIVLTLTRFIDRHSQLVSQAFSLCFLLYFWNLQTHKRRVPNRKNRNKGENNRPGIVLPAWGTRGRSEKENKEKRER